MVITFVNFIPRVQNRNTTFRTDSHKSINKVGAECGVDVLYVKFTVSRTIDGPASIVTHNSVCNTYSL